jgi:hypothetical protein
LSRLKQKPCISANKIKLLHVARKKLGLSEEVYRDILYQAAHVQSSRDLDEQGFDAAIARFKELGFQKLLTGYDFSGYPAYLKKWQDLLGNRCGDFATPEQLALIEADWDGLKWWWSHPVEGEPGVAFGNRDLALRGFLKQGYGTSDLRFLSFDSAHKAIEALKAIAVRRKK